MSIPKSRIYTKSFASPDGIQVDSRKNKLQLFSIERNPGNALFKKRRLKRPRLKTLV